jgi:hypothetical protein
VDVEIEPYGRFWAVYESGALLCVTVYKKGAHAVKDRITEGREKGGRPAKSPESRSA